MGRWFVNQGDALRANLISSTATAIVVFVTILSPDGTYRRVRSNVPFTTNGTRVAETAVVLISTLPEGEVLSMNVATFTANVKRGQCYVQAYVIEQPTMAAGYVFANHDVLLGDNVDPGPAGGHGNFQRLGSADPAAGTEIAAQTVPANALWLLRSATTQLVQGITQTPLPTLIFRDSGATMFAQIPAMRTAMAVSTTAQLTWALGLVETPFTAVVADEIYAVPLPLVYLPAAFDFLTLTDGIGANTNYGPLRYVVEEWLIL